VLLVSDQACAGFQRAGLIAKDESGGKAKTSRFE
jgi:hypothetical protein